MRLTSAIVIILLCAAGMNLSSSQLVTSADLKSAKKKQTDIEVNGQLIVHEWGTFTSFSRANSSIACDK